jgi:hypothetical protein
MHSPVQLINHHLSNVQIRPLEDVPPEKDRIPFTATRQKLAWEQAKNNPRAWRLKLRVEFANDPVHSMLYEGFVEMVGEVIIHEQVPEEQYEAYARVAGGGLLYSAIREWIVTLTSRSLNGMVEIPSINPAIFVQPSAEEKSSQATSKTSKKKAPSKKKAKSTPRKKSAAKKAK